MLPIHLVLYVTSECNLSCPYCNQMPMRSLLAGYEMTMQELTKMVHSSLDRGIHYKTIELTGGEPTLWKHFQEGTSVLLQSRVTDEVIFITNGRDASNVSNAAKNLGMGYVVSQSQATPEELNIHVNSGNKVLINPLKHKIVPRIPILDSTPAMCSMQKNPWGESVNYLGYAAEMVYYCGCACSNMQVLGFDSSVCCPFECDFITKFSDKKFDKDICSICLCNNLVWSNL